MSRYQQKKTFYYEDDTDSPVTAGGLVLYYFNKDLGEIELMLTYSRNNFEDFGGMADPEDSDVYEMIAREVNEESNDVFDKNQVYKVIKKPTIKKVYNKKCKYLICFAKLSERVDPKEFGTREIHDGFDRTVEYIPYSTFSSKEFIEKKLAFRLKHFKVFGIVKEINTQLVNIGK